MLTDKGSESKLPEGLADRIVLKGEWDGATFEFWLGGAIKIEVGGSVHVRTAREWHALAVASFARSASANNESRVGETIDGVVHYKSAPPESAATPPTSEREKPVAWMKTWGDGRRRVDFDPDIEAWLKYELPTVTPLYARSARATTESEQICIDIFNDFDGFEVMNETRSVQMAWEIGKKLSAVDMDKA